MKLYVDEYHDKNLNFEHMFSDLPEDTIEYINQWKNNTDKITGNIYGNERILFIYIIMRIKTKN